MVTLSDITGHSEELCISTQPRVLSANEIETMSLHIEIVVVTLNWTQLLEAEVHTLKSNVWFQYFSQLHVRDLKRGSQTERLVVSTPDSHSGGLRCNC